jgi:transmembrane sensor
VTDNPPNVSNAADPLPSTGPDAELREEARHWFLLLLERPSAARQAEFDAWYHSDPAHREMYSAVEAAWQAAETPGRRLAEKESVQLAVYLEAMDKAKAQRKSHRKLTGLSVLLAAMLGTGIWLEWPTFVQDMVADYSSARGERRSVQLRDGSRVLLDADSAIDVGAGDSVRYVRLLRGNAFFDITPSSDPFIVKAGDGEVRVLGTAFAVRLSQDGGVVTLERGKVEVSTDGRPETVALSPGHQVAFDAFGVGAVKEAVVGDELAWREGRFTFYRARLEDVINEIQRYRLGRIIIATSSLADERVTGSVQLADTDAALASIQASLGFRMHTFAGRLTIIGP